MDDRPATQVFSKAPIGTRRRDRQRTRWVYPVDKDARYLEIWGYPDEKKLQKALTALPNSS
uniref:Uncharacterized protein n=1 Tax=Megaselia scalaris TaxID=36166 RepID=T1H486_MEGSC